MTGADHFSERPRLVESGDVLAQLPSVRRVQRELPRGKVTDVAAELRAQLDAQGDSLSIRAGDRVAIAVGSRGIGSLLTLVSTLAAWLSDRGAQPFIVPAMGSHGAGTAEGQRAVLAHMGITQDSTGAVVMPTMRTERIGSVSSGTDYGDIAVHTSTAALAADHVIPVARVKPHTDFRGPVESGLLKMLAIGLGKIEGARSLHQVSPEHFSQLIQDAGALVLSRLNVPCGVAVVEDGYEDPAVLEVVPGASIPHREPELLTEAREWLARLPFDEVDILVVSEIGKDISGAGMDTNVTGRFYRGGGDGLRAYRIVVLDLSEQTGGNACGMGLADVVTARLAGKVDLHSTYANELAARLIEGARLPFVALDDEEALAVAATSIFLRPLGDLRIAWIENTVSLTDFMVTEPLWNQISDDPSLVSSAPLRLRFDGGVMVR